MPVPTMDVREDRNIEEILALVAAEIDEPQEDFADKLSHFHERDIAVAMEQMTPSERQLIYGIEDDDFLSEILSYVEDTVPYLEEMDPRRTVQVISAMDADDAAEVIDELEPEEQEQLLAHIDTEQQEDVKLLLSYEDDEIGSRMSTEFIQISKDLNVKGAMKELIRQAADVDDIDILFVTDENNHFYGAIDLRDLIMAREHTPLEDLIATGYPYVHDHENLSDCLNTLVDYEEDAIPVLNEENEILGVVTSVEIIEAVDEELGDDYAKFAGLTEEEEPDEPVFASIKKRLPWLVMLLFLGIVVSAVVGIFEGIVAQIAAIVAFQSLVLDMSGNAGTQALAVTIRNLNDDETSAKERFAVIWKELRIAICNGLLMGTLSFILIGMWMWLLKGNPIGFSFAVSLCVGLALFTAMMFSGLLGTGIPMFFQKIGVDPAVASGPFITTMNDLVAVVTYYSLAGLLLLKVMHFG